MLIFSKSSIALSGTGQILVGVMTIEANSEGHKKSRLRRIRTGFNSGMM